MHSNAAYGSRAKTHNLRATAWSSSRQLIRLGAVLLLSPDI